MRKEIQMRVSLATNNMSCQPLRSFGKAAEQPQKNTPSNPAFTAGNTVSRKEYDDLNAKYEKLNAKYDLACRMACAQAEQYNQLAAKYKAVAK